jgi:signal transduction histidine kinase/CheY-like chemotaxis protein
MEARGLRSHPLVVALCFLAVFSAAFLSLRGRLGDAAFILGNLLPLVFAALFGSRWGVAYAIAHSLHSLILGTVVGLGFDRFIPNGIIAITVTVLLSGAIGRIRDLTTSLQQELAARLRYEAELQERRTRLESLVEERTNDLVRSNEKLRQEIAEREKAEAEKRQLEASLKRAEKMEAIGLLAGSVAHDLNNILSSVLVYPELLLLELPEGSPHRDLLVSIQDSGKRAAAVVEDLLTMARQGVTTTKVLNLNEVVSELMRSGELSSLRARHRGVHIETELDPYLLNTQGSAVHLARAILNLVVNSLEAIESGGRIVISTANTYVDTPSGSYEQLAEGEYVALAVKDTGAGIAPEDLDRIFEPFYTRKVMGRSGTGLGMAIVWGTVKDHGGYVDVHSEQGKGTTVTLFLPATRALPRVAPPKLKLEEFRGHGESILVVDDIRTQRDICTAILTKLGYLVASVASGEEAVEYVRHDPVDLLILDMIMDAGIDGLETYRRIVELRPGQKAVIASGFSETERVRQAQALGAGAYLRKPFTVEKLAWTVRDEMQRRSAADADSA